MRISDWSSDVCSSDLRRRVPGSILIVIVALSAFGLAFDPGVTFSGIAALPSLSMPGHATLIGAMDLKGALSVAVLPSVLALSSEERRVGKECVSTCRPRWSPDH